MKNGFTLIELLAVIVILAIIALIAVPIVLNIIDDSKESSLLRSAEFYLDAVEYTIADAFLYHGGLTDGEYPITPDGNICKEDESPCTESNTLKVEVNGDKPTGGTITIKNGNISNVEIVLSEKHITKNSKNEMVYVKFLDDVCTLVSGTEKTAGAKYTCKVDPNKEPYTFYVLTTPSIDDKSINLILDRNICEDGTLTTAENTCLVAWISDEKYYEDVGGVIPDEVLNDGSGCQYSGECTYNDKGPLTAIEYLSNATKTWTHTNEMLIDSFNSYNNDELIDIIEMSPYNTHARMPYKNELSDFDRTNRTNEYLYDYLNQSLSIPNPIVGILGYWTLSANSFKYAWRVDYDSNLSTSIVTDDYSFGVRPVINLKL